MINIMLALLGSTINSAGVVLQKKGLQWVSYRKNRQKGVLGLFAVWLLGIFVAYFISAIPIGMASKTLPPHVVTAMSGWGIVVIVFLSYFFLKERIYRSDILLSLVIVVGTLVIGLRTEPATSLQVNRTILVLLFCTPFLIIPLAFVKSFDVKIRASLFAVNAGCIQGIAIVIFNVLMKQYFAHGFTGLPKDILVLYVMAAVLGALAEQFSYKLGEMTLVASIRLGLFIIYPVICSILLFRSRVDFLQIVSILLIILSCYGIFRKR